MMRTFLTIIIATSLLLFFSTCFAIQVDVQTSSNDVYALGFTVNGEQHGGPGKHYSKNDMPADAAYTFGIRVGGLVIGARDIGCTTDNDNQSIITLRSDTKATLNYDKDSDHCTLFING